MVLVMAQPPHSFHPILSLCNNSASLRQRNLKRYGSNPKNLHVINAVKPITIPPKTENIQIKKRNRKRRKKKQVIVSVSTDGQLGTCISGQLDTCLKKWDNDLDEISDSPLGDDAIESLDEVSDVPFDTDFEEESVDYSLDADISRGVEITIGFRKSALKYLKYKPVEFFKPKIYYFSKDRSIVSCLNVKPGQENSAQIEEIVHDETVEDTQKDTTHDDTGVSEDTTEKKNIDKDYAKSTADQSQEEKKESHSQNDSVGDSSKQDQPKLDLFQGKVFIQKDIDKSERPLLGLEYILEIWSAIGGNLLNFYCLLCKKYLKRHTVLDHVASYFHKVTFMVKHFPTRGVVFPQAPPYLLNKDMKILLEKYCKKIDKSCKRLDLHITCEEYFKKHFKEITEAVENSLHYDENYFSSGDGKEIEIFESDEDEGTEDNAVIEEVIPMDSETIVKPVADCVSPKSSVEVLCSEKDASDENYLIMDESNSVASASDLDGSAVKQASINKSITNADGESFVKSVCAKSEQLSASSVSENVSECENSVVSKKVGIDFGGKLKTSPKGKSIQGVFTKDNKKASNKEPSKNGDNSPKMSSNQYSGSKKAFSAPTGKLISKTKNCEGKMLPCDVPQNLCITPMSKKKKCVHGKVTSSSPGYRKVAKKALMSNKNWKPLKWPQSSASMDIACVQDKLKTANEKGVSAKEIWENLPNNASKKFDARRKGTKPGGEAHIIGRLHHSKFEYKSVPEGTEYKSRGIGSSTFAKGREQMGKCESVYPSTVIIGDNKVHDARQHNLKKVSPTTKLARHSRRVIRKSSRSPVLNRHKIHQKRHTRSPIKRASRSPSTRRSRLELEEQYRNMFQKKSKSPVPTRSEIVRRSRSPIMQQSRSPVRHRIIISPIRRHVISSSRRQSRSPIRRQSRSPVRRQSRSPVRRQSRSPVRRQSRSPVRRRTRSPVRRQVRSPVRRQVRSPVRRKSRSPLRRRSRSATKKSRSPVRRESIRRRSRSLIRREVRTQRKRLSRSPTREWSGSPNFRRSSFSLSRSQSEEPIVESENNNLYTLDSRVSISVQNQRQDTWHPTEQIIPNIGHQFHNQTQYMSAGIPQPPLQFQQFHNPNQIFNSVNMPSGSTAAQPYSQLPTSSAPLNTQIPNFPANINFPPPQLHQAMKPNSGSVPVSTYQGLSSQAYPVTNQAQAPQSHTGMNQPSQSVPFISNKNIFQDMRNTVSKLFGGPDASKTSPALQQEIARIVGLSTDAQNENVQYINEANKGNSGQLNKGYESEISSLSKAFIQNQIFTKASEENNNLGMSFLNFNELLKVALIKELPQKFFSQTSQHTGNQPEPFLMNPLSNLQAQTGKPQTYSNLSASNSFGLMKNSGGATDQLRSGMDSKVSYCDRSANANRGNIFPIVKQEPSQFGDNKYMENVQFSMRSQDHQLSGANVTVESKQKASLAQRLASVLVKLGMTDMPGNLLSEMLAKIGAFIKSPSHEISESEIISILKSCGYISHNL